MDSPGIKPPRSAYAAKLREFPGLVFTDQAVVANRGRWRDHFRDRIGPGFDRRIIFEIGCFDADYLARIAAKYPTTGFIGLDWKFRPLYEGAQRILDRGVQNISLLRGRGQDIAKIFAGRELDEIWIFHPDPCDRPVELKNRLMNELFLKDAHRVLRHTTSRLCLKTDHQEYYQSVFELFGTAMEHRFETAITSSDFWKDDRALAHTADRCFASEITLFEQRFLKKRQPIYYVEARKK